MTAADTCDIPCSVLRSASCSAGGQGAAGCCSAVTLRRPLSRGARPLPPPCCAAPTSSAHGPACRDPPVQGGSGGRGVRAADTMGRQQGGAGACRLGQLGCLGDTCDPLAWAVGVSRPPPTSRNASIIPLDAARVNAEGRAAEGRAAEARSLLPAQAASSRSCAARLLFLWPGWAHQLFCGGSNVAPGAACIVEGGGGGWVGGGRCLVRPGAQAGRLA